MGTAPSRLLFAVVEPTGLDLTAERGLSGKVVMRFGGISWEKSEVEDNARPAEAEDVVDVERGSYSSFAGRSCRRQSRREGVLEGVEPRKGVVQADEVDGLTVVDKQLVRVDYLIKRTLEDLFIELDLTEDLLLAVTDDSMADNTGLIFKYTLGEMKPRFCLYSLPFLDNLELRWSLRGDIVFEVSTSLLKLVKLPRPINRATTTDDSLLLLPGSWEVSVSAPP
ncbi:hypothetical protein Tco_1559870 [Tanacetum coccineum]